MAAKKKRSTRSEKKTRRYAVQGGSMGRLLRLRKHPGFDNIIACLTVDRDEWKANEKYQDEDYPGEARERREAYEMLIELLTGKSQ
jgi:hypothetical protein